MAPDARVLRYFPHKRGIDSSALGWYVVIAPFIVAMLAGMLGFPALALPLGVATVIALWIRQRRERKRPQAVLKIIGSRLQVTDKHSEELLDISLDELLDVSLDTKTVQRVQENAGSAMPDLRFIDSQVGPALDESRIEFETVEGSVLLSQEYTANYDATDWFGQIRKFLRRHGWVPQDERSGSSAD